MTGVTDGLDVVEMLCATTVQACRPPYVPVPRPGPCKGWKTPEFKENKARERQKVIDEAKGKAGVLAELEELVINETEPDVLTRSMKRALRGSGLENDAAVAKLIDTAKQGDSPALTRTLAAQARRFRLRRIGGTARTARFDRSEHEMVGGQRRPPEGTPVQIIRPGYDFRLGREYLRLAKAIVETDD